MSNRRKGVFRYWILRAGIEALAQPIFVRGSAPSMEVRLAPAVSPPPMEPRAGSAAGPCILRPPRAGSCRKNRCVIMAELLEADFANGLSTLRRHGVGAFGNCLGLWRFHPVFCPFDREAKIGAAIGNSRRLNSVSRGNFFAAARSVF